jgi:AraC-like DNA-binding protein
MPTRRAQPDAPTPGREGDAPRRGQEPRSAPAREPFIIAEICHLLLRAASLAGADRAATLEEAGLTEMDIAERDAHVPLAAQLRLGRAAIARMPASNLALFVAHAAAPGSLGVLGHVMANCSTLGASLEAFARFHRLLSDAICIDVSSQGPSARVALRMEPALEELRHPVEAVFALWVSLARQLTGVAWKPQAVTFRHRPAGPAHEHEAFFGAPVRFEAPDNALLVDRLDLALAIRPARPDRHALFTAHAEAMLSDLGGSGRVSRRLAEHLVRALQAGPARQQEAAAALGMSVRTLSRRLRDESTTFGEVLERVRRDLAMSYLRDRDRAVYEVAFLLGYGEPSTFHRSFRRWTGLTPLEFRNRAAVGARAGVA